MYLLLEIIKFVATSVTFFFLGKYSERLSWNRLIKKGVIPKPKSYWTMKDVRIAEKQEREAREQLKKMNNAV